MERLGPETVAPPPEALIPWKAEAAVQGEVDPASLIQQPDRLAAFLQADPRRMDAERMQPELLLSMAQILLRGNRTFLAEQLLSRGAARWPDAIEVHRAWARVLLSIGRPQSGLRVLDAAAEHAASDPTVHYLRARALLQHDPRRDAAALAALRTVISLDPSYKASDGLSAQELVDGLLKLEADPTSGSPR